MWIDFLFMLSALAGLLAGAGIVWLFLTRAAGRRGGQANG